jgi:hypothetical protein
VKRCSATTPIKSPAAKPNIKSPPPAASKKEEVVKTLKDLISEKLQVSIDRFKQLALVGSPRPGVALGVDNLWFYAFF